MRPASLQTGSAGRLLFGTPSIKSNKQDKILTTSGLSGRHPSFSLKKLQNFRFFSGEILAFRSSEGFPKSHMETAGDFPWFASGRGGPYWEKAAGAGRRKQDGRGSPPWPSRGRDEIGTGEKTTAAARMGGGRGGGLGSAAGLPSAWKARLGPRRPDRTRWRQPRWQAPAGR